MLRIYHWIIIVVSLLATVFFWQLSRSSALEKKQTEFLRQSDSAVELFEHELKRYADILRAATGFVAGSEEVHPNDWSNFTKRIDFEEQYSGLGGLAVVYRVMRDDVNAFVEQQRLINPGYSIRPVYDPTSAQSNNFVMALSLVAPDDLVESMTGFDLAHEKIRLDAIMRAMKTGEVQITAPVQFDGSEVKGFVLVAPIFDTHLHETEAERESSFVGVVVGAIVVGDLVKGVLDTSSRQVAVKVSDGDEVMYSELVLGEPNIEANPLFSSFEIVKLFGREWRFDVQSTESFRVAQSDLTPSLVLLAGLLFNAMLILLLAYIARSHKRLDEFGRELSHKYKLQSIALEERNEQLETFSHMASHDLKGPLTSIGFLAECIEQDLNESGLEMDVAEDIAQHVKRLNVQVALGKGLIKGILQYSEIGSMSGALQTNTVDVRDLLIGVRQTVAVKESQLKLEGEFPVLDTYDSQLTQVFLNLISNGFKYHHGDGDPEVIVSVVKSPLPNYYRFVVSDNGIGISQEYHRKIFEPFSTLQPKDHSLSSGIGLAIVKKLVVEQGGSIEVASVEGRGASFSFDWPRFIKDSEVVEPEDTRKAA